MVKSFAVKWIDFYLMSGHWNVNDSTWNSNFDIKDTLKVWQQNNIITNLFSFLFDSAEDGFLFDEWICSEDLDGTL